MEFHRSQLFKNEVPMEATLSDGRKITVITRPGLELYGALGRPANMAGVGAKPLPQIHYFFSQIGRQRVQIHLNTETKVLTCDLVVGNTGSEHSMNLGDGGRRFELVDL